VCAGTGAVDALAPGGTRRFTLAVPLVEVLGDSLPDGRYAVGLQLGLEEPGSPPEIPAGAVDLRLARAPLAARRVTDGLALTAAVTRAPAADAPGADTLLDTLPDTLRVRAALDLINGTAALVEVARDCPLVLHVYRTRARRDAAPRTGPGDVVLPARCAPRAGAGGAEAGRPDRTPGASPWAERWAEVQIDRGRAHVLVMDAAWPTGHAGGRGDPGGRYFLAAEVRLRRRTVWIAAGDVRPPRR
jgi:hypothetical protein